MLVIAFQLSFKLLAAPSERSTDRFSQIDPIAHVLTYSLVLNIGNSFIVCFGFVIFCGPLLRFMRANSILVAEFHNLHNIN